MFSLAAGDVRRRRRRRRRRRPDANGCSRLVRRLDKARVVTKFKRETLSNRSSSTEGILT